MLEGKSTKQSLIQAGFAESTAINPKRNNLTAEHCIPEYLAIEGAEGSQKLIQAARGAILRKLQRVTRSNESIDSTRLGELSRTLDTIEKYHGAGSTDHTIDDVRSFADRLRWLQALGDEMRKDDAITAEVETIE